MMPFLKTGFLRHTLISSEWKSLLLDTILGDDVEMDPVTSMNLTLSGRDEYVMDDVNGFLHTDRFLIGVLHVHESHLIVKQWLKERHGRPTSPVGCLFAVAHRIVAVHTALPILIQSTQNVRDVVGKESLVVQHGGHHLSSSWGTHRLVMSMAISFQPHLSNLAKS